MRVRWVRTASGERRVGGWDGAGWRPVAGHDGDLLALLARADLNSLELGGEAAEPTAGLPFAVAAFRDCSLWEDHLVAAARGLVRLAGSAGLGAAVAGFERATGRTFPRLRPSPLWHQQPLYYKGNAASFVGDGDLLRWPAYAQALDYELEVGVVLVRPLSDASPAEALAAVGGFVLLNDVSARDVQLREMTEGLMGPAKSKDFCTALGPVVVTVDELLGPLDALTAEVRVNGERWGLGSAAGMRHSVADAVSHASTGERLVPGEVIGLGTLPGCSGLEVDRWLAPGDEVVLSAGPLGELRNVVGEPEPWRRTGPLPRQRWSVVARSGEEPDPAGVDPVAWSPPAPPAYEGPLARNTLLDDVERWEVPGGAKPEDVVFDDSGALYAGVEDGRIWRWPPGYPESGGPAAFLADTHGRPLGLEADPRDGTLLVCDAYRGLLRVHPDGAVRRLADTWAGRRLRFTNNAAVTRDGVVYFSDSSTRFRIEHYKHELLEHRPNGRVFRYDPASAGLDLVADGLYFPNGVSLTPDESALLVAQTGTYEVSRIPLTGPDAGRVQALCPNLPGFPDNMAPVGDDTYWVALASPRLAVMDRVMPVPALRRAVARVPDRLQPAAERYGLVVQIDGSGRILRALHGPAGRYIEVTGVRERDGWLYLGSLAETAVGRVRLPAR